MLNNTRKVQRHTLHQRLDGTLLDGRRLLETIRIDTPEKFLGETHIVEVVNTFRRVNVGFDDIVLSKTQTVSKK
jgi:hypothetical protein